MVQRSILLEGIQLLNPQLDNHNFTATDADNLKYTPSSDGEYTEGLAQVQIDAEGGTAPLWRSISYYLNRQDVTSEDNPYVPFEFYTELWGITSTGNLGFIGEDIVTTCPTSLTSERREFDLLRSACHSKFTTSSITGTTGKITLNLPFRTDYYEELNLEVGTYSGWKRYKTIPITGNTTATANIPIVITLSYDSDMNNDFSDIRFIDWNGNLLNYGIISKTNGSTATFAVKLTTTPESGVTTNLYAWYKKSGATSTAVDFKTLYAYYDDFEDGKYTGRTLPYKNWWTGSGTKEIISTGQIEGNYSFRHTGAGSGSFNTPGLGIHSTLTDYTVKLTVKLTTQGTLTTTPYINLFYLRYVDDNNFLRLQSYWTGTYQVIQLIKLESGAATILASWNWKGSKWAVNESHTFIIRVSGSYVKVTIDSTDIISGTYACSVATTNKAIGCGLNSAAMWDNIEIYPYIYEDPTVGTVGSERQGEYGGEWSYTATAPDTLVPGTQQAKFTTPTFPDTNPLSHITYKTGGTGEIDGNSFRLTDGMILNQGYNSLDIYKSLILRFYAKTNSNYTISIDDVKAQYEI